MGDRRADRTRSLWQYTKHGLGVCDANKAQWSKGQVSMEYLLIATFSFFILISIMLVAYSQSASFSNDVTAAQIQKVGNEIIDAVNAAYYAGPPTKKTVMLYFPDHINAVTIANQSLVFSVQGAGGTYAYALSAAGNMTGSLRTFAGLHKITVIAQSTMVNITDS